VGRNIRDISHCGVFASTVFGLRLNEVGWVLGAFGLSMFIARPLIGLATSSWSQKKLAASGVLLVGLASIIVPLWPHPNTLIASRLMLGVGTGFWVSFVVFYVARSSHSGPKAMAQISTVHGVGSFISATLGGALVGWFGWFAPFWSGVVFSFFAFVLLLPVQEGKKASSRFRLADILTLSKDPNLLAVSFLMLVVFWVGFATLWGGFNQNFAHEKFGVSPFWLGGIMLVPFAFYAVFMWYSKTVREALGIKTAVLAPPLLIGAAVLLIPFTTSIFQLLVLNVTIGIGVGVAYPTLMSLSIENHPPEYRGTAMGIFQAIYAVGIFAGPWVTGQVFEARGVFSAYFLNGGLAIVSALFLALLIRLRPILKQSALVTYP